MSAIQPAKQPKKGWICIDADAAIRKIAGFCRVAGLFGSNSHHLGAICRRSWLERYGEPTKGAGHLSHAAGIVLNRIGNFDCYTSFFKSLFNSALLAA
jgi:hypothetical protein